MREFLFGSVSDNMLTVIGVAAAIAFLVLIIIEVLSASKLLAGNKKKKCLFGVICVLALLSLWVKIEALDEKHERKYEYITECIENGYTLYVNGEETDFSYITSDDCTLADVTICDEDKKVCLTARDYDLIYRIEKKKVENE